MKFTFFSQKWMGVACLINLTCAQGIKIKLLSIKQVIMFEIGLICTSTDETRYVWSGYRSAISVGDGKEFPMVLDCLRMRISFLQMLYLRVSLILHTRQTLTRDVKTQKVIS